jgi:hypothetical protein
MELTVIFWQQPIADRTLITSYMRSSELSGKSGLRWVVRFGVPNKRLDRIAKAFHAAGSVGELG